MLTAKFKPGDFVVVEGLSYDHNAKYVKIGAIHAPGEIIPILGTEQTYKPSNLAQYMLAFNGGSWFFPFPIEEFDKMPCRLATSAEKALFYK